ncbi:MAG: DinB family protein [Candidatus Hydrogenedentes bacterium]|nr:DinB family protein [Candidatus Hydrogenedentota bacterium]
MDSKIELLVEQLSFCREHTLKTASGVPEAGRLVQLRPAKAHPLWLLGHLANTANVVMIQWALNGESMTPKGFGKKFAPDFGGGDPVSPNAADYPSWDEVVGVYTKALDTAVEGVSKLSEADLPKPLPGRIPEPLRQHFSSVGKTLNIMVLHDSYHRGQIGLLAALDR